MNDPLLSAKETYDKLYKEFADRMQKVSVSYFELQIRTGSIGPVLSVIMFSYYEPNMWRLEYALTNLEIKFARTPIDTEEIFRKLLEQVLLKIEEEKNEN